MSERMEQSGDDLAGASVASFAPSVRAAAQAFVTTWCGLMGESGQIATGFAGALHTVTTNYVESDADNGTAFDDLDGRLGPAT